MTPERGHHKGNMNDEPELRTFVIAVGNQKGGVGKTTATVHLARALTEIGRRVLVWDLDMNCGATRHFGVPTEAFMGTFEVLVGEESPANVILTGDEEGVTLPTNLHLIPSRRRLEAIDEALAMKNKFLARSDVLLAPLAELRGKYDYVFLDTAPNATSPTIASYRAADAFLLTAIPDPFAIDGLRDAILDIQAVQRYGNPSLRVLGVVLSAVDERTRLARTLVDYVEQAFRRDAESSVRFKTIIHRSTVIPAAQKLGLTLFETDPHHKVADQYRQLAREVEARLGRREETASVAGEGSCG
jgi:chromosome partitioning protein